MTAGRVRVIQTGARTRIETAVPVSEKRISRRRPGRAPGLIYPGGVAASIPCTIVDQSVTGAKLHMQPGWVNPFRGESSLKERFSLVMRLDKMTIECEIMWLEENAIGVRFVSAARPLARRS